MLSSKAARLFFLALLSVLVFASACTPGQFTPSTAAPTPFPPTAAVTSIRPTPVPTESAATPTAAASPTTPALAPAVKGFALFDATKSEFRAYGPDGSLLFTSAAPGIQYLSPATTSVVSGAVYFMNEKDKKVFRSSPEGIKEVSLPVENLYSFRVSPDEKWMAWSTMDPKGASALWTGKPDGRDARQIASYNFQQSQAFLLQPIEWTTDGRLLFERAITGVGGYILFGGHNSLYRYDPADGQFTTFVPAEEMHMLCLDSYRLDLDKVVFNCSKQGPEIVIRDLRDGSEKTLPKLDGQGLAGSARFSPSGQWLAYAIAAGDYTNEQGQIFLVPADLSAAPAAISPVVKDGYAYVQGWLDEDTLLFFHYSGPNGRAWTVKRDGSQLKELTQGYFAGWIR